MGFWIFMTLFNLLIPATMLLFGSYFEKKAPNEMNGVFGYRTSMSMKNRDTWQFAHHYCGRLWKKVGKYMLYISAIISIATIGLDTDGIGWVGAGLSFTQMFFLIGTIFPTEKALKKNFDQYGFRRKL